MEQKTEEFYKDFINKLINEVKNDFINEGYDEEAVKQVKLVIKFL